MQRGKWYVNNHMFKLYFQSIKETPWSGAQEFNVLKSAKSVQEDSEKKWQFQRSEMDIYIYVYMSANRKQIL